MAQPTMNQRNNLTCTCTCTSSYNQTLDNMILGIVSDVAVTCVCEYENYV